MKALCHAFKFAVLPIRGSFTDRRSGSLCDHVIGVVGFFFSRNTDPGPQVSLRLPHTVARCWPWARALCRSHRSSRPANQSTWPSSVLSFPLSRFANASLLSKLPPSSPSLSPSPSLSLSLPLSNILLLSLLCLSPPSPALPFLPPSLALSCSSWAIQDMVRGRVRH